MPRKKSPPAYRLHKARNCAVVTLDGKDHYLGPYGSDASHELYARLIASWKRNGVEHSNEKVEWDRSSTPAPRSVNELLLSYLTFAENYYVDENGLPAKEFFSMKEAVRSLRRLYGLQPASEFGPVALKNVRQSMIDDGLSRGFINQQINRIKRVFKWGVCEELLPPGVYEALRTVSGLRYGRTTARETKPVRPVGDDAVDAVIPYVSPQVAAMIQLQRLTGMRPGEVVKMRLCDIDRTAKIWIYEVVEHKNRHRGQQRIVPLGPRAQELIANFVDRPEDVYLFSPREAENHRNAIRRFQQSNDRKTPIYPSELKARKKRRQARLGKISKRPKRDRYETDSYRRAVTYGIKKARLTGIEVESWHPHQLRHSRATELRKRYGIEAAQVSLGHARADVTQVYAERDFELAKRIAEEMG